MSTYQKGFSTVSVIATVMLVGVGFAGWSVWRQSKAKESVSSTTASELKPVAVQASNGFIAPKKGAHFESSTPANGSTIAGAPVDVVIDFNFDLASNSSIKIEKDGKDYSVGETKVDPNKLALRRQMDQAAPDGIYTVNYSGCWPDKTCHDGYFQFAVNRSLIDSYQDQTGVKEATILLSQTKFQPMNVRVNSGQTITWVNNDDVVHYVNTDSHPAHTQVTGFNSRALAKGATYSFTFKEKGVYLYHCSAHAAEMVGSIVVE